MDKTEAIKIAAILAAVGALVYLVKKKGGVSGVVAAVTKAFIDAAGETATGVLDGVSTAIGIPTTSETLTDDSACRAYMDANGVWSSIGKCAAPAFIRTVDFWPALTWMPKDTEPRRSTPMFDRQL